MFTIFQIFNNTHLTNPNFGICNRCLFYNCKSSNGGAIFIDFQSLITDVIECSFFQCIATDIHGGGICVNSITSIKLIKSCFERCSAPRGSGYVFKSYSSNLLESEINYTLEYFPLISAHGSLPGALNKHFFNFNNITGIIVNEIYSPLHFGTIPTNLISNYCIYSSSISSSLFNIESPITNCSFFYYNFINNSFSLSYILIREYSSKIYLNYFNFISNQNLKFIQEHSCSGSIVFLQNCNFNQILSTSQLINVYYQNCNFNHSINLTYYNLLNSNLCWGRNENKNLKIKKKKKLFI